MTTTTSKSGIDTVYTDNDTEKSTDFPERHITLNNAICFIQNKYHNYPAALIKSAITEFYLEDEIFCAKQTLLRTVCH